MTTQPQFFLFATNALLPKSGDFIFTTVKMSTTSINSRAKLITSGEIDFRCDLTTDSFFTKWGVENNLEHFPPPGFAIFENPTTTESNFVTKRTEHDSNVPISVHSL